MSDTTITSIDGHDRAAPATALPTNMSIGMLVYNSTTSEMMVETGTALKPTGAGIDKSFFYSAPADGIVFVASRAYTVKAIRVRPLVAGIDAGAVTAVIKKAPSGTAIAAGTALHSGTADLKGTINVNQTLTVTVTTIAAGDAIGIDVTGVTTAATGVISIQLMPA